VIQRTHDDGGESQLRGEIVDMPPEERTTRLNALWQRLMDPDGFDRAALATMEGTPHTDQ
jgi:hypothetical protein